MVTPISGIGSTTQATAIDKANAKLQAAVASLASGNRITQASDDVASLSVASQLQSETSGLKQASTNLAQAGSLTQVADGGAEQIQKILTSLQNLAQQANSPTLTADNRADLNKQFQSIADTIDKITNSTTFGGKPLLDGSVSGDNKISLDQLLGTENTGSDLSVDNLSASSLFGGQQLNLSTADGAANAFAVVGDALNKIVSARADIGSFQSAVNFAAANVDSAIVNQEAARSTLEDTDFATASTNKSLADIQRNASIAVAAQTNKLTPALLKLVS